MRILLAILLLSVVNIPPAHKYGNGTFTDVAVVEGAAALEPRPLSPFKLGGR